MKREQTQQKANALDFELARLENTSLGIRGMMALAAGFIRYSAHSGSMPSEEETDAVAFALERFGGRLARDLWSLRCAGRDLLQTPEMQKTATMHARKRQ